ACRAWCDVRKFVARGVVPELRVVWCRRWDVPLRFDPRPPRGIQARARAPDRAPSRLCLSHRAGRGLLRGDFTTFFGFPAVAVVSPPRMVVHGPTRVAWEYAWFPLVAKGFRARAVLGPFNLIPEVWPGRRPFLGVIVSNLAPFSAEVRRSFSGMTRARLETLNYLTRRAVRAADRVFLLSK